MTWTAAMTTSARAEPRMYPKEWVVMGLASPQMVAWSLLMGGKDEETQADSGSRADRGRFRPLRCGCSTRTGPASGKPSRPGPEGRFVRRTRLARRRGGRPQREPVGCGGRSWGEQKE